MGHRSEPSLPRPRKVPATPDLTAGQHEYDGSVDLDPAYWRNLGRQAALVVGIGALIGGPIGFITWRLTHNRAAAVSVGVGSAVVGLVVVGYLYLTIVLCPPGAGCV